MADRPSEASLKELLPTSDEFTRTLGQVAWLMTLSQPHRDKPIAILEKMISAALIFKQVRVYVQDKKPIAAVVWAYVSSELKSKILDQHYIPKLKEWRSGPELVIVDCTSPFLDEDKIKARFVEQYESAKEKIK